MAAPKGGTQVADQRLANGVTLHVVDEGSGQPVVFIHGVMMSGRFLDAQTEHFAANGRVVIPDLRGHGRSEKVLDGHTVENYAADLRELFDAMSVERNPVGPLENIQVFKRNHRRPLGRLRPFLVHPSSVVCLLSSVTQSFGSRLEPRYIFGAETLV